MPVKTGTKSVKLVATDKLGNHTRAHVALEMLAESDFRNTGNIPYPLLAQRTSNTATDAIFFFMH